MLFRTCTKWWLYSYSATPIRLKHLQGFLSWSQHSINIITAADNTWNVFYVSSRTHNTLIITNLPEQSPRCAHGGASGQRRSKNHSRGMPLSGNRWTLKEQKGRGRPSSKEFLLIVRLGLTWGFTLHCMWLLQRCNWFKWTYFFYSFKTVVSVSNAKITKNCFQRKYYLNTQTKKKPPKSSPLN